MADRIDPNGILSVLLVKLRRFKASGEAVNIFFAYQAHQTNMFLGPAPLFTAAFQPGEHSGVYVADEVSRSEKVC